jgi:hypothetical protein
VRIHVGVVYTLLCQPVLLVCLQTLLAVLPLHGGVGPCLCEFQAHLLAGHFEGLKVVDRVLCAVDVVVDDKSLSLALKTLLCDNVDDGTEILEKSTERLDQGGNLDALVEVANLLWSG